MDGPNLQLSQIIHLLMLTQGEQVQAAELALTQLAATHKYNLLQCLTTILMQANTQHSIKLSCATFLNSSICDDAYQLQKQQYVQFMSSLLLNPQINSQYKRILQRSIVNIIDQLQQPQITQFRQTVFPLMQNQQLRDTGYLLIGCFCVPEEIDIQHIVYLANVFLQPVLNRIVLPKSLEHIYVIKEYNQILKLWIVVWDRLSKQYYQFKQQSKKDNKQQTQPNTKSNTKSKQKPKVQPNKLPLTLLQSLTNSQPLSQTLLQIYPYLTQHPLYICTTIPQLNVFKQQAAQLHHRVLTFAYKKSLGQAKIVEITEKIIGNFVINLALIAGNSNILAEYQCEGFAIAMVKVVRGYLVFRPASFKQDWKEILKTIVFPLIKANQQQLHIYQQSAPQFVALFEDCTQKQTYGTLKSQMCKLLQKISDKSQKITQQTFITDFIINFCIDSIIYQFLPASLGNTNVYQIQYLPLDTAVTCLSIFSYRFDKHKAKMNELRLLFKDKQIVLKMKPYYRTLFYLFMSYNYSDVYQNPQQGSFWIQIALQQNTDATTIYCAYDFLFNIANQYYSDYFVQQLTDKALTTTYPIIWDAMQKLITYHLGKISPGLCLEVIGKIFQRLDIELNSIMEQGVKETLSIMKLIQILKAIAQNQQYCKEHDNVRNQVWKIGIIIDKSVKLKFQDQIFSIVQLLLKHQSAISNNARQFLPIILRQFSRDEYYQVYFYKLLNIYIYKPNCSQQILAPILKCLYSGLMFHLMQFGQTMKKSQRRLILSHLLILVQNIIALHGKILTEQQIVELSCVSLRFVPNQNQQEKIDCAVVLARALNVMIMCSMFAKDDNIWNRVQYYANKDIYFNYDIRVLIACVKFEIFKETNLRISSQMVLIIAYALENFRNREKLDQNAKKIKAKYGKDNRLKLIKYKEYEQILKYIDTPFKSDKKLQLELASLLQSLKQANNESYSKMVGFFSKQQAKKLCQMCQFTTDNLLTLGKRQIFTVLKPKAPQAVQREQQQDDLMRNGRQEEVEADVEQFKRKRKQEKKKTKNAKTASQKIDLQ